MEKEEVIDWNIVLSALEDLVNTIQYQCIGIHEVKDSFVDESLARARKVCTQARNKLLEEKRHDR